MSAISNYLNELYLYEEVEYLDESFASWVKKIGSKKVIDKLQMAAQRKDLVLIRDIISDIPKVDADKLRSIGKKINKNFDKAYRITEKEAKKQFPELTGNTLKYFTLVVTPFVTISKDMKTTAKDKITKLRKKSKKFGFKKFVEGEGMAGMFLAILAGIFVATAMAHLSLFPLLIGIAVAGFAGLFMLEGAFA